MNRYAFRASLLHFLGDPFELGARAMQYFDDGILLVEDGRVAAIGDARELLPTLPPGTALTDYSGKLILPGFVDTHIHYAQTDMIASYGEQLLAWLEKYTFPTERRFDDPVHAGEVAEFFADELLKNGTTTAHAFATVHPASVDALFGAAERRGMRMLAGKVMMDRNCPEDLRDSAERGYVESQELIARWHKRGRLGYSVTPRFAPTSTERQMELAGQLFRDHPDLHLQSHVAENQGEVAWVAELYPARRSYLDVYDHYGQLGARSVYAHCIWLDEDDRRRMAETGAAMSFCPTSNLFLGSGLFDLDAAQAMGVRVGIGTDVGGGTSFSMLRTLHAAYGVLQLKGQSLSAARAFYLATLGGARSLYLDDRIGNFEVGKEADFVVLDPAATPLLERRMARADGIDDRLFALMMLGDDRAVAATHVMGVAKHVRDAH
ncbi:guanine deaminase [Chitinimonas koreensis]|uniref:guanine deaminase n=1 Tax=Chitinimonas koreensis TaxID=356302 RepID=UPI000415EF47|nr:guanine deaminase [Chitinimonas koreensis]QNM94819.1 guanine deaminase [Chitinimonas koreensis]